MSLGATHVESTAAAVVTFPDEVDIGNAGAVHDRALRLLDARVPGLILDLTGCRFCDSSGLDIIIGAQARASALGIPMWVVLPSRGRVRRICEVAGLPRRVAIAPDLDTAMAALAPF